MGHKHCCLALPAKVAHLLQALVLKGFVSHRQDFIYQKDVALELNSLYVNQKNRERAGIVHPGKETEELRKELREKLGGPKDPQRSQVAITEIFNNRAIYSGPYSDNAPDLIIGYNPDYRPAWDSVMGKVTTTVFEDNAKAWSKDHCIDARLVPRMVFANRKI